MKRYRDTNGDSGVAGYEYGEDNILVQFKDGSIYEYTNASAGPTNIARMKALADRGNGLNAFINKNVKRRHSRQVR